MNRLMAIIMTLLVAFVAATLMLGSEAWAHSKKSARQAGPQAVVTNPCAAQVQPCAANPCAPKAKQLVANPCAANPCGAKGVQNPCAAKNPCAANPCAVKNPCGAMQACAAKPAVARMIKAEIIAADLAQNLVSVRHAGQDLSLRIGKLISVRQGPHLKTVADLKPGQKVTVSYIERNGQRDAQFMYIAMAAAANPCGGNPCAVKNPCAANPCAAKNPCAVNPCAPKANPCAVQNPCGPAKR